MLQLTASASNLSRIEEKVDEYASLLMEVLDPENLGYIEVSLFFFLLFILVLATSM
jgi:respiratory burst oxidase